MGSGSSPVVKGSSPARVESPLWLHLDPRWRPAPSWVAPAYVWPGGRAGAPEPHNSPARKPAGIGACRRRALGPVTQRAPHCPAQRLPSASLGDCSVFMFHPGLPVAEPASWADGLRRDPGIRCCAAVPPPSQADVTAAAREAFLLQSCWSVRTGLWDLGSPAVRRTLSGLSSLLAGALSCWFLKLPGLAGLDCQEFLLAFWGKVVPLRSQVPLRPWFGCLTGNSVKMLSLCACVCMCPHVLHPGRGPGRTCAARLAPACCLPSGPHFFGPWLPL